MCNSLKIYVIWLHIYSRFSILCLHQKGDRKQEKLKKKGRKEGWGWGRFGGKPGIRSNLNVHLGNIWIKTLFIEIITSLTLSTRQLDLLSDPKDILFTTIQKKKKSTIYHPVAISWAILYVTWTEFIYLIFSPRLIGCSAHKQVTRIQLDICESWDRKFWDRKRFLCVRVVGKGRRALQPFETRGFRDNISHPIALPNHAAHIK